MGLTYLVATRWRSVSQMIGMGDIASAMEKIKEGNTSGGVVMMGLTNRRADEVNLYLNGRYEMNGSPLPVR